MSHRDPSKQQTQSPPEWVSQVMGQLRQLAGLAENWDSYGALPPNSQSLALAEDFITSLAPHAGVERPEVSLTANGNVAFLWESFDGVRNLDAEILPNGVIQYVYADEEDESRDEEGQTTNEMKLVELLAQW